MPRNGSGVMTPDVDFTTEAASPPIEISKLDQVLDDIADELTNSIAADGQTNPTANLKMNGFKHTNVGAATALTEYGRVSEIIDQDLIYYVDSGAADAYVITPSPAIAAYEEGQRFVFRAAHANTGASTLNVNGLGAIAIKTNDGGALAANTIILGGFYEVTYDESTTPDRWVLQTPSKIPDGMLSSNIALKGSANTFTANLTISNGASTMLTLQNSTNSVTGLCAVDSDEVYYGATTNHPVRFYANNFLRFEIGNGGNYDFKAGTVTTDNATASEPGFKGTPQNAITDNYTLVLTDAGKHIKLNVSSKTITIPANGSVAFPIGTVVRLSNINSGGSITIAITTDTLFLAGTGTTGSRTLTDWGMATIEKVTSTGWMISGIGLS